MIVLNTVIEGDAIETLQSMASQSVQVVIADPPYYNVLKEDWDTRWDRVSDYLEWSKIWVSQCMRVLRDDGLCFICGQLGKREHGFLHLMSHLCLKYQFHDLIIWDRVVGYNERRDSLTPAYEMILVLRKSDSVKFRKERVRIPYDVKTIEMYLRDKRYKARDARFNHLSKGKYATNILSVPSLKGSSNEKCGHPSQKPLDLIKKLVLMSSDEGDIILDPFLGSGTTAVAAEDAGRSWIGIEKDSAYCQIAQKRLEELRGIFITQKQQQGETKQTASRENHHTAERFALRS
jgi:site-specific DNA-methyltransferase (adenine-specific)